jgi:hypothetical protein
VSAARLKIALPSELPNFTALKNTEFRLVEAYFQNWNKSSEAFNPRIFADLPRLLTKSFGIASLGYFSPPATRSECQFKDRFARRLAPAGAKRIGRNVDSLDG